MLYCNCHYRYKEQICELIGFVSNSGDEGRKVRIRFQNGKETICSENDLEEIPLTESILQSCYKMKTIVRDGEWDVLWNLGGKNNVTVGERRGKFYLIPYENVETVIELLPRGFVQGQNICGLTEPCILRTFSDLERVFPELITSLGRQKIRL